MLDSDTGFLASLPNYMLSPANFSEEQKQQFYYQKGVDIRDKVVNRLIKKILRKLFEKRVIERPNDLLEEFM